MTAMAFLGRSSLAFSTSMDIVFRVHVKDVWPLENHQGAAAGTDYCCGHLGPRRPNGLEKNATQDGVIERYLGRFNKAGN